MNAYKDLEIQCQEVSVEKLKALISDHIFGSFPQSSSIFSIATTSFKEMRCLANNLAIIESKSVIQRLTEGRPRVGFRLRLKVKIDLGFAL